MMGVGEDGTYKKQDVEFTEAISGEKEKTRANLQETEKRIRDLGGAGLLSLAGRKNADYLAGWILRFPVRMAVSTEGFQNISIYLRGEE